jgi:hypothetical protein
MSHRILFLLILPTVLFIACEKEGGKPTIDEPSDYTFLRDGNTTVDFTGQTTRILMAEELITSMLDFSATADKWQDMYRNEAADGGDVSPFASAALNAATQSIRSKVAASADYFSANTAGSALIKAQFANWLDAQYAEIFPARNQVAVPGTAGQLADGTRARYVSAQGLEYNQLVAKSLLGALMLDQMLNNYLGVAVLDAGTNRLENDNGTTLAGEDYTDMEHKWDEAYGYLYGTAANLANPNPTIGDDDSFLNEYLGRVEDDPDFKGIAGTVFAAFKLGRAAIVAGDYTLRDQQAAIIRTQMSKVVAVRAVFYLQQAKLAINSVPANYGGAFHDLSEAYGFIYSLQFTRRTDAPVPYFTGAEVDALLADLLDDGPNGLWDVTPATLDALSATISAAFGFTVAEAAE